MEKQESGIQLLSIKDIVGKELVSPLKDFIASDSRASKVNIPIGKSFIVDGLGVIFCLEGNVTLNLNSKIIEVGANTIHVLFPHHIIKILKVSDNTDFNYIFFN